MISKAHRVSLTFAAGILSAAVACIAAPDSPQTVAPAQSSTMSASTKAATRPSQTPILAEECLVRRGISYVPNGVEKQKLDVYAPAQGKDLPVVLFVHGGEWAKGDKSDISTKPKFFNEHNIIFVSTNYRLSATDKYPAQVNDIAAAIRWCKDHITEYGGNPANITLMGHSAGCHLVTMIGLDPRPLGTVGLKPHDLRRIISWSGGAFDLVGKVAENGMYAGYIKINFGNDPAIWRDASPIAHVANAKSAPPFLFVSAGEGNPKSEKLSEVMVGKIRAAGGEAKATLLPGKTHFAINHEIGQENDPSNKVLLDFIHDAD
jgi:acetyl esterase/lipase